MNGGGSRQKQVPRELRRRVALPARLRCGASWSDVCILNVSNRGLMIYAASPLDGDTLELQRGDHVIRCRVAWRDGMRLGLQAEDRVPVDEIMTLSQTSSLQLVASGQAAALPRGNWAAADTNRMRGRALEFIAVGIIAAALALSASAMVQSVLSKPLAAASLALSGTPPPS